jgi:hypothetical protein
MAREPPTSGTLSETPLTSCASAGHGDRLFDGADLEGAVQRADEVGAQLHRLEPLLPESRQGEGDGIDTGSEIGDAVLAVGIGDGGPGAFDQDRAGDFDGHARQHGAAGVLDRSGERTLRCRDSGKRHRECPTREKRLETSCHAELSLDD